MEESQIEKKAKNAALGMNPPAPKKTVAQNKIVDAATAKGHPSPQDKKAAEEKPAKNQNP